jgi:hypothetical protein
MKWTIDYLEEEGVISIKTSGVNNWDELKQMCREAFRIGQEHNAHKYLADHQDLQEGLSVLQIDDMPRMFREIGLEAEDKVALVYRPDMEKKFKFFQSVSDYALLNFKLFTDKDEAIKWLKPSH